MASLPLALDPVLSLPAATQQARRTLGDNFDERLKLTTQNFTTTIDNKVLFACGFWDNSFRVFHSESGNDKEVLKIIIRAVCICTLYLRPRGVNCNSSPWHVVESRQR